MPQVASYFAKVGVDVDAASFTRVDRFFSDIQKKLRSLTSASKALKVPLVIDEAKARTSIRRSLSVIGKEVTLKISNVDLDARKAIRQINSKLSTTHHGNMAIALNPVISQASLRGMQQQIRNAINGLTVSPNISPRVSPRSSAAPVNGTSGGGHRGGMGARGVMPWLRGDTGWSPGAMMGGFRGALPFVAAYAGMQGLVSNNAAVQSNYAQQMAMDTLFANAAQPNGQTIDVRQQANALLMNHVRTLGLDLKAVRPEFTNFMASSMPSIGFQQSADVFKAFTTFGMTRGADAESIHRALVALGQMSSKGQVYSEELKGQLAEASGFGEMIPIFAQAYQDSLHGRGSSKSLVGQEAIAQLLKDMKDGKVKTQAVLPLVMEEANRRSAPGREAIANSPTAAQGRATTAATSWLDAFSRGGGANAWTTFWKMIEDAIDNSAKYAKQLGEYFDLAMGKLRWFNLSVSDLVDTLSGKKDGLDKNSMFGGLINDTVLESLRLIRDAVKDIADAVISLKPAASTGVSALIGTMNTLLAIVNYVNAEMGVLIQRIWEMQESRLGRAAIGGLAGGAVGFAAAGPVGGAVGFVGGAIGGALSPASTNPNSSVMYNPMEEAIRRRDIAGKRLRDQYYSNGAAMTDFLTRDTSAAMPSSLNIPTGLQPSGPQPDGLYHNTSSVMYGSGGSNVSVGTQNINVNVNSTNASPTEIADKLREAMQGSYKSVLNTQGATNSR